MNDFVTFLINIYFLPAVAAPLAAVAVLLVDDRSLKLYFLAFQYVMVAWLTLLSLPFESALAKLVTGLIATFVLFVGAVRYKQEAQIQTPGPVFPRGRIFRITAVALVAIGTIGISFETWMPVEATSQLLQRSAMLLLVLGLLGISLFMSPLQVGISLVTLLSGFEIIYSAIEPSLAVIALLALVHLGIALVISYFEIIQVNPDREVLTDS
jgi:hypothetical protein